VGDFSDTEVYGQPDESGRPANIPEKFYTAADGDTPASIDVGSLLTSHNYFESKIGQAGEMIGSPEDTYSVPTIADYEFQENDPMVKWFSDFAKENNLSQTAFENITKGFIETQGVVIKTAHDAEMEKLGPDGTARITAMNQRRDNWLKDLPKDRQEAYKAGYEDATTSAASFEFMEFLTTLMQPSNLPSNLEFDKPTDNLADLAKQQMEVYPEGHQHAGKRRYEMEPDFRKEILTKRKAILGDAEDNTVVG
jgi:hypothetical protein